MYILFSLIIAASLLFMLLTAITNLFLFPKLSSQSNSPKTVPFLSILIPARNEVQRIAPTVQHLLQQDYPNYEIIVLDDNSEDGTYDLVQSLADDQPPLQIQSGQPLPDGWLGKNWACHQLAQAAQGDVLIFSDADVQWHPQALNALIAKLTQSQADLLTIWPTQSTITWGERLTVPLMALVVQGYLPIWLAHHVPLPQVAAANGQCMIFSRDGYERCGGHASVRGTIIEDIALARQIKRTGQQLRMVDGNGLIGCRMYRSWDEVRDGYAKNIRAGYGNSSILLILATLFHLIIFVLPWLWFLVERSIWPLILIICGVTVRAITAGNTDQRISDALLMPISALLMTRIAVQALWWQWKEGGPQWKGRRLV